MDFKNRVESALSPVGCLPNLHDSQKGFFGLFSSFVYSAFIFVVLCWIWGILYVFAGGTTLLAVLLGWCCAFEAVLGLDPGLLLSHSKAIGALKTVFLGKHLLFTPSNA